MHSSNDAAQQLSLKHANLFSFPPTQRTGLLDSTKRRSSNQRVNLERSFHNLLDALSISPV